MQQQLIAQRRCGASVASLPAETDETEAAARTGGISEGHGDPAQPIKQIWENPILSPTTLTGARHANRQRNMEQKLRSETRFAIIGVILAGLIILSACMAVINGV